MRNAGAIAHYINGGACEQRPARLRNFAVAACALDAIARCQYAVISTRLSKGGARVQNTLDSRTICCGRVGTRIGTRMADAVTTMAIATA